ncbi:stage III sporulation protein AF [Halobacillus salinus]|uniref:Stage III sporulation protein AF n=1 Tax=Halobacillus salinus TaxID=192814 RepID=A0A4Z0H2P5_9BACI|nr:stage III sporulation protein AF [Halobacillus salinus]TGB04340.1 stage III sporulation protein AF [Halobacillus salinus]
MEWFINWITQIVLFLLLAMVADTLLPSGLMKRYARLVMSILLLLIFLGPLLNVLKVDPEQVMTVASEQMNKEVNSYALDENIEKKKSEILEGQDAYKLEQVTQSLKAELEAPLKEEQNVTLLNVELSFQDDKYDMESLDKLMVTLSHQPVEDHVKEVKISFDDDHPEPVTTQQTEKLRSWLSDYLGVASEQIEIRWEEEDV